jgi:hypothetical protein
MEISRRQLRYLLFSVRDQRNNLDKDEQELAEEVYRVFHGYLLGSVGWLDFSFKWDINPGPVEDENIWSQRKLSIADWSAEIINLWEWKEWSSKFQELYGKERKFPPPCFTRQEVLGHGRKG